jgi:hypothetical protein
MTNPTTKTQRKQADKTHQAGLATLLAGQEDVEAAQARALVPKPATLPAPVTDDPLQDYLDATTTPTIPGIMFRFNGKDAKYVQLNGEPLGVKDDAAFFFLCDQVWGGWINFDRNGGPPTRVQGLLNDGFRPPPRESLGDLDESQWEIGLSGRPQDPWAHQLILLLQECGSGELYAFVATNPTSRGACTDLIAHCQRRKRSGKDDYPMVKLGTGSFERREPPRVKVWKPVFHIVGHQKKDSLHDASLAGDADMNDAINF